MQIDLTEMVPKLKKAAEDTEEKMKIVAKEKAAADILATGDFLFEIKFLNFLF